MESEFLIEELEEMAIGLTFKGFSDKLFIFAEIFIDIMFECAKECGFDNDQVLNSIEKCKIEKANSNIEVDSYAVNNRLLFLLPHTFHSSLIEEVLVTKLQEREDGQTDFCPGKFLRERILDKISSI